MSNDDKALSSEGISREVAKLAELMTAAWVYKYATEPRVVQERTNIIDGAGVIIYRLRMEHAVLVADHETKTVYEKGLIAGAWETLDDYRAKLNRAAKMFNDMTGGVDPKVVIVTVRRNPLDGSYSVGYEQLIQQ